MSERLRQIEETRHVVVKVGSAVLLGDRGIVDRTTFVSLVEGINDLLDSGKRVTVVSSGAVALGRRRLDQPGDEGPPELPRLQALAALGQARLIQMYDREFAEYDRLVAQVLLGRADLDQRTSFLNARLTLDAVHRLGAVPIVNENDTVATEEIRFGDNDELAAAVCGLVQAQLLVILSDVEGILARDDDGELGERISSIEASDPALEHHAGPSESGFGRGGMISKVAAARTAGRFGAATLIAPGKRAGVLQAIARGDDIGTLVTPPPEDALLGRKVWLGAGAVPVGRLDCDDGARRALTERGASLLPSGIRHVEGDFAEGSVVEIAAGGETFARGMATYSSEEIRRIMGHKSDAIAGILGFKILDAVVHRDNLLLL